MELVFLAPEITPYSRTGEIGDVCAALPKALRGVGHKVTVISPLWPDIDANARGLARRLSGIEVELGGQRFACTLHDGRTTGGVELVFIGHPELFSGGAAGRDARALFQAALVFSHAAAQVVAGRESTPDVVQAHGWFAAAGLPLIRSAQPNVARVLTVHDPRQVGSWPADAGPELAPGAQIAEVAGTGASRSLLRAGIAAAQRAVALCESDADELTRAGLGLENPDEAGAKLIVIANGLDAARWNPLTDPMLPSRFDPVELRGKARCKDALQLELGFAVAPDVPLVACVGTLDRETGGALIARALPALLQNELQLLVAGGDAELAATASALAVRYEDRLRSLSPVDERAAHRAVAAADLLLVPGRDPAYPDLHLSAQRYGALPIARSVGAAADAIVDCDAQLTTGNGFVFEGEDPADLVAAVQRAIAAYARHAEFDALRRRVMKLDVSWERSARRYEHLYKALSAK